MTENNQNDDKQTKNGNGRNINTGGGSYNEGGTFNQEGGVFISGGSVQGGIHYTDNRIEVDDKDAIEKLFIILHQKISEFPSATQQEDLDKTEAEDAAKDLKQEIEEVKKNPDHKPNKFKMQGFIAAFKKLGAPVFNAAMTIIGLPAVGQAVNQFAQALPDTDKKEN